MKNIKKIADEIQNDWFGPSGKCWCKERNEYVNSEECGKECPECEALRSQETKNFRYLHLHDDFKSY